MAFPSRSSLLVLSLSLFVLAFLFETSAQAAVRVENICRLNGEKEQRLLGLGLVIGLKGTGDGGSSLATIRPLMAALENLNNPIESDKILKDTKNVALVMISATIPENGLRKGQKVNCTVSSIGASSSLKGGELLISPLRGSNRKDSRLIGLASGEVTITDISTPTRGMITNGVVLESDLGDLVMDYIKDDKFELVLDKDHATYTTASAVASAINQHLGFSAGLARAVPNQPQKLNDLTPSSQVRAGAPPQVARARSDSLIEVEILPQYRDDPVEYLAEIMGIRVDNVHTEARILINRKTGTVVVTGEVELDSVIVTSKNLTIRVGDPDPSVPDTQRFVALMETGPQATQHLRDLLQTMNQLKVPPEDIAGILEMLKQSGKLHAVLIVE